LIANTTSSLYEEEEYSLDKLMKKRKDLLDEEEAQWCLKIIFVWLKEGDNNSKKIHKFVNQRKLQNTSMEIKDSSANWVSSFEGITNVGKDFFLISL
jgi:hypothetical protein